MDASSDFDISPGHHLSLICRQRATLLSDCNRLSAVIVCQLVSYEQFAIDIHALPLLPIESFWVVQLQLFVLFKTIALR